ncbi:MAG: DUF2971 domain-containing protein [Lachnospiraceae bacterium]|nr:DUF2971 domain-containing protein [Lachnospiraceae bacterium]
MILYHYTSMDTAVKILENHSIWASDITRSNDYLEMNMVYPDICDAVYEEHEKGRTVEFQYAGEKGLRSLQKAVMKAKEQIDDVISYGDLLTYVLCFSEGEDLLSQWRSYADDGRGVAIGFDSEELKTFTKTKIKDAFALQKVEYKTEEERKQFVELKAYNLLHVYKEMYDSTNRFPGDHQSIELIKHMITWFMQEAIAIKPEGFSEEQEWRLFIRNVAPSNDYFAPDYMGSELKQFVHENMDCCVRNGIITTFIPINLNELGDFPIKSIMLGPTNSTTERDMKFFLEKNGYQNVNVERSKISYRR